MNTLISPQYIDLYRITTFTNLLLPILFHIYIIDKDKNNKEIKEIYDYIFEILFEIYLSGIYNEPSDFLYFLTKFEDIITQSEKKKK